MCESLSISRTFFVRKIESVAQGKLRVLPKNPSVAASKQKKSGNGVHN